MNCKQAEELMGAYVMHALTDEVSLKIWRHLQTCESCRGWYREVQDMEQIWADEDTPVEGLNLVDSVLSQIQSQSGKLDAPIHGDRLPSLPQTKSQRRRIVGVSSRMVYVHYGLAASFTIALFQLGVFQHLGIGLVKNGVLLSHQVQSFLQIFSAL